MTYARAERAALCDLLDRLGPDAPTLCAGWTTADLAAHLVLRERRLDAAPGIAVKPLAGYTASVQQRIKTGRSYPELVDTVRQGPPRWSPYGLVPAVDMLVNMLEFLVHHEDVRRAAPGWEPRELPAGLNETVWKRLSTGAPFMLRKAPVGVVMRLPDGRKAGGKKAEPRVVVTGEPMELLLFAFGRQEHARLTYEGDQAAVERLRAADLGV
ncbi:TIGR03085 family protein [Sphaerisporangium melleum]|uniref:TIGR03085 family protein n=1 Tax=Sphaerisporangium melleum TaxID=321316 RepID=A0A917VSG6_9ACTN|nr:TIGR03085 family metal-binding protein [Sphaerisporangium melleum]GGL10098.1 TIGR03085 family protein [Sphaerisporangium melleum]GII70779.1 TIGR03085 family protein [Sphaerisporangium melleum]